MSSIQSVPLRQRRFAPLGSTDATAPQLKGIVFDVDGTLCLPQNYMFSQMRNALGIEKKTDILHHIRSLPSEERLKAAEKIKDIEREAMTHQQPQPGLVDLMDYLHDAGVRRALCTRNFEAPVMHLLSNHLPAHVFVPIITRETPGLLPKPDPDGILHIAKEWGLDNAGENLIMVGDSLDDMTAGHTAGAATVLLLNDHNGHLKEHEHTDLCIQRLDELIGILQAGFVGR
ncbi:putative HAD superfamily hydrolase [Aspergillus taichungensis]|uniref:Putative HAD superfamily hydrolase n=1 Tax=Aspergillus taichungensis TaxID=482145 RepID=A0A2J5I2C4_9EURO|nr:putative HAD superfamily hydrolase [Aspergillus taichungensis]